MKINPPQESYDEILSQIESDASPVGIDAKKTHVLILHMLLKIEERLGRLEEQMAASAGG
jgi:hypothetical protein